MLVNGFLFRFQIVVNNNESFLFEIQLKIDKHIFSSNVT